MGEGGGRGQERPVGWVFWVWGEAVWEFRAHLRWGRRARGVRPPSSDRSRLRGMGSGSAGSNRGVWSRSSGKDSWAASSVSPPAGPMPNSVWGGPLAGWMSGGEVGSPMWARICVMGSGSVRNAMKVRGVWQVGQMRGKTS